MPRFSTRLPLSSYLPGQISSGLVMSIYGTEDSFCSYLFVIDFCFFVSITLMLSDTGRSSGMVPPNSFMV